MGPRRPHAPRVSVAAHRSLTLAAATDAISGGHLPVGAATRPDVVQTIEVTAQSKIATHPGPVGRERTNFIVQLDLAGHGMPGNFEQCWTRTDDHRLFELCCIPFFTYGLSL